ncbi:LisH [Novymonas esmeraldas]|uniref:LisH n=1 Tax=Novymonas esmeraldas TaxID=1808958 RepID=A0AAW0F7L9_9TRYP
MATVSSSSSRVVPHERVLRYVYEFLDENGYQQTLRALQAEAKVPYNTIHVAPDGVGSSSGATPAGSVSRRDVHTKAFAAASERNLEGAVMEGSWAEVLHVYVDGLLLPEEIRATLYEVILEEMVELHGLVPAARSLLLNAPAFQLMRSDTPARYIRLEKMIEQGQRTMSDGSVSTAATRHVTAEMRQRRTALLLQLKTAIRFTSDAPVGRLAAALARAQASGSDVRSNGSAHTVPPPSALPPPPAQEEAAVHSGTTETSPTAVLTCAPSSRKRDRDPALPGEAAWADTFLQYPLTVPKGIRQRLPYAGERAACCCAPLLSADSAQLLVGTADGAVDFVRTDTGEGEGAPLRHTDGVLCMARDSAEAAPDWLAVGYRDGWVKVYNVARHSLVRRFERAHAMGVTTLQFAGPRDSASLSGHHAFLVTGSFDGAIQVLDIAAGAVVRSVANSHASAFVHAVLSLEASGAAADTVRHCLLSCGNDGTLAAWRLEDRRGAATADGLPGVVELQRVQQVMPLALVHRELRDAVPTQLYALPRSGDATSGASGTPATTASGDALVLTRAGQACVVRVTVKDEGSRYFSVDVQALCIIATPHPLRSAFPRVHTVVSMPVPLLTLYAADSEGTVSLHNIEMRWCNAEQWAEFGGCMRVSSAADQSAAVIVEVGKAVKDLQLTCTWSPTQHQPSSVIVYSPSLPAVYEMC